MARTAIFDFFTFSVKFGLKLISAIMTLLLPFFYSWLYKQIVKGKCIAQGKPLVKGTCIAQGKPFVKDGNKWLTVEESLVLY